MINIFLLSPSAVVLLVSDLYNSLIKVSVGVDFPSKLVYIDGMFPSCLRDCAPVGCWKIIIL